MFETKKTLTSVFGKSLFLLSLFFFALSLTFWILIELKSQGTFDMLELFAEDAETIRLYASEVMATVFEEIPKFEFLMLMVILFTLSVVLLFIIRRFKVVKNKLKSLYHYWFPIKKMV